MSLTKFFLEVKLQKCFFKIFQEKKAVHGRASNRLKYRSGLGSGAAKFIFSGLAPVQVFRHLSLKVQFRLKLKML